MRINLLEIPEEGREYIFESSRGELVAQLKDLVHGEPFRIRVFIRPLSSLYEIQGEFEVRTPLICGACAEPFRLDVKKNFRELLMVGEQLDRRDKGSKVNHLSDLEDDDGSFCSHLDNSMFDAGEFIHEQIAFSEPTHPLGCPSGNREACENYKRFQDQLPSSTPAEKSDSPFLVLKNLKL